MAQPLPEIDEAQCLQFVSKLVQIKSHSETQGELEITRYIADELKSIGLESHIYPFDNGKRQNTVGIWRGSEPTATDAKSLLFNGHVDVNPVTSGWTVDPYGGKVDDKFIYGIGVSNMKSGCAAYFCAVRALKAAGWKPRADVILTFVVGELQGGVGTVALIEQGHAKADCFINCEPSDVRAITMHAESLVFEIELFGVTRHMSLREEATDAILAACELIPILTKTTFRGAETAEQQACNRCSVGVVHGALGKNLEEWRPPQIADYCKLSGAARYAPGQTYEDVVATLTEIVQSVTSKYKSMTFTFKESTKPTMPAFQVSKESQIVKSLNKAYREVRQEEQPTGALAPSCFYGSDAGHLYKLLGMEGVVCGSGGRYNTRPDEKVDIPDYLDSIRVFMRVIVDISG